MSAVRRARKRRAPQPPRPNSGDMEKNLYERDKIGVQDCVLLEDYKSQEEFINNLYKRFSHNLIYTYIGNVLVSVNPYKSLHIYGQQDINKYHKTHIIENPPHVFAIAEAAYSAMMEEGKDHCILISGESGSGKTVASKKVLEYIAAVSGTGASAAPSGTQVKSVKDKLLRLNPVLEAFGNAKTIRNDNSSRFGKYMDIEFSAMGVPIGGNILNYLLEKSRVVHQNKGERNFHIFYQLLAGGSQELLDTLHISRNVEDYNYLTNTEGRTSGDDRAGMEETRLALTVMGITAREQGEIMAIVGSILHLGNIQIVEDAGIARVLDSDHLTHAAQLLGCEADELRQGLTSKTIYASGERVSSPLDQGMAVYARDALAKAVYDRLFSWLVGRFNQSLQPQTDPRSRTKVMGILDIYGFEIFETNSFEQFCINYCNEKLQQLFIELTLKSEQEEYLREGIEWEPVEYFNNNIIINLIEEKHKGIISLLDEECLRPGNTSDQTFLDKMTDNLKEHKHFISHSKAETKMKKKLGRNDFALVHYAGDVIYDVNGFLDKNNDLLLRDLREVMSETRNSIAKAVFPCSELMSKKRPDTAITQFKMSLNELMNILMTKEPSYIRCIKPNHLKQPGLFERDVVCHQVKYLGLMENLRVRRAGFAYRRNYNEFLARYKSLSAATWPFYRQGPAKEGVRELLTAMGLASSDYRLGKTKVFIRYAKTLFFLEDKFQERKHFLATLIQARWRGFIQWRRYEEMRAAAIVIQKWTRRYLARNLAQRRRHAVGVIRRFIEGFITRHGPPTELNHRFIQTTKTQFLLRLAKSLPKNVLDRSWPTPPKVCLETSELLRKMHLQQMVGKYCKSLSAERKAQLELKVLAESLFKGKKKSYPSSIPQQFVETRLVDSNGLQKQFFASEAAGEICKYITPVVKFDRHGYKRRDRVLLLTESHLYLSEPREKRYLTKHKLSLTESVLKLEVTSERDSFLLIRISSDLDKGKGDLILEVPNLIEFITKFVDVSRRPDVININNLRDGKIRFNFEKGKEREIDLTLGANGPSIVKGQQGQLVVVG